MAAANTDVRGPPQTNEAPAGERPDGGAGTTGQCRPRHDSTTPPIEALLSRLEGVRETGAGRWSARCPAHEDREPSLSIREAEDGRVLLHCFAGCPVEAVVAAVGLDLRDLFPPRLDHHGAPLPRSQRPVLTYREALALLRQHVTITLLAAEDLAGGRTLTVEDLEALRLAAADAHDVMEGAS